MRSVLFEVIAVMINALFVMPNLKWGPEHEIDHLEMFAGDCSVSRGEFQELICKNCALKCVGISSRSFT